MNFKAKRFNKKASNKKNKPDKILVTLKIKTGQKIADVGAGGGYFSLRFAELVGKEGQVFAVDTNSKFLEFVRNSAQEKGLNNIKTVIITADDSLTLSEKSLDLVFIRNVYHHLTNRVEYFRRLKNLLKPEGRIAIIEYTRSGRFTFHRIFGHYVLQEKIIEEMNEAGYQMKEKIDFLPEQSFTIFTSNK